MTLVDTSVWIEVCCFVSPRPQLAVTTAGTCSRAFA
jgi:hypothetical protein